jgi:hypothetical protein
LASSIAGDWSGEVFLVVVSTQDAEGTLHPDIVFGVVGAKVVEVLVEVGTVDGSLDDIGNPLLLVGLRHVLVFLIHRDYLRVPQNTNNIVEEVAVLVVVGRHFLGCWKN